MDEALRVVREEQYQEDRGDRPMVNNVAIVILAQRDNDDVSLLVMPCYFKPLSNPWSELVTHNNHKPLTPGFPRYLKKDLFLWNE